MIQWCADGYQRLAVEAGLELGDDLGHVGGDPRVQVRQADGLAFLRVGGQVDQPGRGQLRGGVLHVLLGDEDKLEVVPLDAVHLRPHPVDVPIAVRHVGRSGEPVELVEAVDNPIVGRIETGSSEEGGEPVGDVHDVVAAASGEDVAWPAGDARCAEVAFAAAVMIVGVGLIGTVSASVASWFVRRHSEPGTEPADVAPVDFESPAAMTADLQAPLLDRLDELAARQDEIRAMLSELQRPPTST